MTDILAIGVHPDDVELAAGGTIISQVKQGKSVNIVDLTRGELGTRGSVEIRAREAEAAAKILGVQERINLALKDGFISCSQTDLLKLIAAIRHFKPQIVLGNSIKDRHPDHGDAAKFIAKACFLAGLVKIESSYNGAAQEPHRPTAIYHYIQDRFIQPHFVVDITPHFEKKMEAILAFKSQFHNPDSNEPETPISTADFLKFLESRAREMGRMIGTTFGEGFTTDRPPGITNLQHLL